MSRTPTSAPYRVHSSVDGSNSHSEETVSPTLLLRLPSLEGSDRHSVVGPTPTQRIQFVDGLHAHFRTSYKFAGRHFEKPIIARDIWYIHKDFLVWIICPTLILCLEAEDQAFLKSTIIHVLSEHNLYI